MHMLYVNNNFLCNHIKIWQKLIMVPEIIAKEEKMSEFSHVVIS